MLETNAPFRTGGLRHAGGPSSVWVVYPQGLVRYGVGEFVPPANLTQGKQNRPSHRPACGTDEQEVNAEAANIPGRSLCQQSFFVCTVRKVGDIPGTGSIYVEAVVDCDSGTAFAKVYPARNAIGAVDILVSRIVPFFQNHQITIGRILTRKTDEYCGLPLAHPYETFLMAAHIQHLQLDYSGQPVNYVCENFFQALLRDFFPAVLRKKFDLSLAEIQKELDGFVELYNLHKRRMVTTENLLACQSVRSGAPGEI